MGRFLVEPDIRVSGLGDVMTFPRMWEYQGGLDWKGFPGSKVGGSGDSWAGGG